MRLYRLIAITLLIVVGQGVHGNKCLAGEFSWTIFLNTIFQVERKDCNGVINGSAVRDVCGVCGGDGTSCARYVDNGDGTIIDQQTGLRWQKSYSAWSYEWDEGKQYCSDLVLGEYTEWRLPTFEELQTLVVCSNGTPTDQALDSTCDETGTGYVIPTIDPVFDAPENNLWTITPVPCLTNNEPNCAWEISFDSGLRTAQFVGDAIYSGATNPVKCVHD